VHINIYASAIYIYIHIYIYIEIYIYISDGVRIIKRASCEVNVYTVDIYSSIQYSQIEHFLGPCPCHVLSFCPRHCPSDLLSCQ
jgi:hypothetical protein